MSEEQDEPMVRAHGLSLYISESRRAQFDYSWAVSDSCGDSHRSGASLLYASQELRMCSASAGISRYFVQTSVEELHSPALLSGVRKEDLVLRAQDGS